MIKEAMAGKSLLAVGAAVVFCGAALYAVGQTLDYLFRDVNPERVEQAEEEASEASDAPEAEEAIADPA